jgi:hypothetical protein
MGASVEIWISIPSAPGWLASDCGRVWLPHRVQNMPRGGFKTLKVDPTFGHFDAKNRRFKLSVNGKTRWVSPLICEAFHGPRPSPLMQCMHLDEDSTNNKPSNLAWGTRVENHHAPKYLKARREFMLRLWAERRGRAPCLGL